MAGTPSCGSCHPAIWESYRQTAHSLSSTKASSDSIRGSFVKGHNVLRTENPDVYFQMERQGEFFYVTAHDHGATRRERFDLVMGSGRRGQSYLFLKNGTLYQLPVSYSALADGWVLSPGYPDGQANFDREIRPSCMGCHSTLAEGQVLAGIQCVKCHGPGEEHPAIRNPAKLAREDKIAICAGCHSGMDSDPKAEVHGNQVGLLRRSRCFQNSPEMACSTCHNVHQVERNLAALSTNCVKCHADQTCKQAAKADNCIDCHMPRQESQVITFRADGKLMAQRYRTHTIGIYR
jgi:predicted CXXCH cytochrome family protein